MAYSPIDFSFVQKKNHIMLSLTVHLLNLVDADEISEEESAQIAKFILDKAKKSSNEVQLNQSCNEIVQEYPVFKSAVESLTKGEQLIKLEENLSQESAKKLEVIKSQLSSLAN